MPYPLNWLAGRAGWVLEELCFQDFGFRMGTFSNDVARHDCAAARSSARVWWARSGANWNRHDALLEALNSDSTGRISLALEWLRYGDHLARPHERPPAAEFMPRVNTLCSSANEAIRQQARALRAECTPPSRRVLTVDGIRPGSTEAEVLSNLRDRDVPTKVPSSGSLHVWTLHSRTEITFDGDGVLDVTGNQVEENGKVVCKRGDSRERVESVFGTRDPEVDIARDYYFYRFEPASATVKFTGEFVHDFSLRRN